MTEILLPRLKCHQVHELSLTHRLRLCPFSVSTFCKYLFRQAIEVRASSLTALYFQNKTQETQQTLTHTIQFQTLSRSFQSHTKIPVTDNNECGELFVAQLRNLCGRSQRCGRMVMNHESKNETHEAIVTASVLLLILRLL